MLTQSEIQELAIAQLKCRASLLGHTRYFFRKHQKKRYIVRYHHQLIADKLEQVMLRKVRRLAISVAPRLGKTELAVIAFIAHAIGLNPAAKFIHLSATDALALENSEKIRDLIETPEYQAIYPNVKLKYGTKSKKKWYTTAGGGLYALSAGGQVTGFGAGLNESEREELEKLRKLQEEVWQDIEDEDFVDDEHTLDVWCTLIEKESFGGAIIYDDSLKPEDGNSDVKREGVNRRWVSTVKNRVNSRNTPVIIIQQRVHKHDLIGYVIETEGIVEDGGEWDVLNIPELYVDAAGELCCLDPTVRSIDDLVKMENSTDAEVRYIFQTQHQQNPKTREGLMYPVEELKTYNPAEFDVLKQERFTYKYIDPANKGGDFLAAIYAALIGNSIYIFDVVFNKKGTDHNLPILVENAIKYGVNEIEFEGNQAWYLFGQDVRDRVQARNRNCKMRMLTNTAHKHTRIHAQHSFILNNCYFRSDWQVFPEYRAFIENITSYPFVVIGEINDDGPDALAGLGKFMQTRHGKVFTPTPQQA